MQLQAEEKLFRVQAGPRNAYRIVYQILDQESVVLVAKIGHRSEVYRRLP
jgi:mRNA-degrading endonuclease RelE of RelBE toxin-antitoxin system